jgi:hypothetical protein
VTASKIRPPSRLARTYRLAVGDKSMTLILGLLMFYMFILVPLGELGLLLHLGLNVGFPVVVAGAVLGFVRFPSLARLFVAAALAVLESLVGIIYPAVLIARLVSLDVIDEQEARHGKS